MCFCNLGIFAVLHRRTIIGFCFTFVDIFTIIDAITIISNRTTAEETSLCVCTVAFDKVTRSPGSSHNDCGLFHMTVRVSLTLDMAIVCMFFTFIDIKAIHTITNEPDPTFTLESTVIVMTHRWDKMMFTLILLFLYFILLSYII